MNPDSTKEIFTELDNNYYRKLIKDGKVIDTEPIELMPTGLKLARENKDRDIEKALDKKLSQMGIYSYNLPSQLDYSNSPYLPPVGKQHENSCVGWSAGYYLRTYQQGMDLGWNIKNGEIGNPDRVFSPSFIYNQINGGTDGGAYMEDAGNLLKQIGASPLSYFPYTEGDYWTQPDSRAIQAAYPHRIRDWRIIYTKNDSKEYIVQKTKEYLNTRDLLIAGIRVGFKFNYPMIDHLGNAIITTENYPNYGHAVVIVGYDDYIETPEGHGAFKIINSYGREWGNDGLAYLTYDAYAANIEAGYVFTDLVNDDYIPPIENVIGEPISPTKYKITFDKIDRASGYRLLDEDKRVVSNFYTNNYTINIDSPGETTMYIQPFNQHGVGEMTAVEIDTTGIVQKTLNTEVREGVAFDITFTGSGRYDVEIENDYGTKVYESKNNIGKPGINTIYWNGLDLNDMSAEDGMYHIKLLDQYFSFDKESKLNGADSFLNKHNGEIKSVDVDIFTKADGTLDLYIETQGIRKTVHKGISLESDRKYNYNIDILKYVDINRLDDAKIIIDIK